MSYIAEYSYKIFISGWNDKYNDIQVENNGSQSNDIVEIWAGQTNQPAMEICSYFQVCAKGNKHLTGLQSKVYT